MTDKNFPPSEDPYEEDLSERLRRLLEADTQESDPPEEIRELRKGSETEEVEEEEAPPDEAATQLLGLSWGEGGLKDPDAIPIGEGVAPEHPELPDTTFIEPEPEQEPEKPVPGTEEPSKPLQPTRRTESRPDRRSETPPPPMLGDTPTRRPPQVDAQGMALPKRVSQDDREGTRVSPSAYTPPSRPVYRPPEKAAEPVNNGPSGWQRTWGCLLRSFLTVFFLGVLIFLGFSSYAVFQYYRIERTLPRVNDLRNRASQFETSTILDRNGNVLYEIIDPNAGRRTYVKLNDISPFLIAATIATEDRAYFSHPGFDAWAILRAFYQNWQSGETVSGASTITQQLARMLFFDDSERYERTYMRKVREALLAIAITDNYSKEEILELYLNEINYGNLSYGIEAASQTYFGVHARSLTMGQAAFLAGLPQAPAVYDIYTNPDAVVRRLQDVLILMVEASFEGNCIPVGSSNQPVCVETEAAARAYSEILAYPFEPPTIQLRYPHWVTYIRSELEKLVDAQTIYRTGFIIHTTLDPVLQDKAQEIVSAQIANLADRNAGSGALIAIDPATGEIMAMVGSADFYNEEIDGQVNMTLAPRQPGSSIKPLTYIAAFEKGWTPSTLIWDVQSEFPPSGDPNDPRPPYIPVNYDERFHGPVTLRSALANSYNIPAVKALEFVGVYDNPNTGELDGLVGIAQRMGITSLTRNDYGLSLTLGGGEVPLIELAGTYQVMANSGRRIPPVSITKIEDINGNVIFEYNPPSGDQVIRTEHAFLISNILSDNVARTPAFGPNSVLNFPFQVAAKTGTTNDFRDNLTIGFTNDIVVGVWVGNADNTPMINTSGLTGAAPIFAEFIQFATDRLSQGNPGPFPRPAGITEKVICTISGAEPSQWCPGQRSEFFAVDQLPRPATDDLWKLVLIDTWTDLEASPFCSENAEERLLINTTDVWARRWIRQTDQGRNWAEGAGFKAPFRFVPRRACNDADPQPTIWFSFPTEGYKVMTTTVEIVVQVNSPDGIEDFSVQWGEGDDPKNWTEIAKKNRAFPDPEPAGEWVLDPLFPPGPVTLRIFVRGKEGGFAEKRLRVIIEIPTPTPTPTPTETPTETPTPTPTETPVPPTSTPTPPVTPTPTTGFVPTVTPSQTPSGP